MKTWVFSITNVHPEVQKGHCNQDVDNYTKLISQKSWRQDSTVKWEGRQQRLCGLSNIVARDLTENQKKKIELDTDGEEKGPAWLTQQMEFWYFQVIQFWIRIFNKLDNKQNNWWQYIQCNMVQRRGEIDNSEKCIFSFTFSFWAYMCSHSRGHVYRHKVPQDTWS